MPVLIPKVGAVVKMKPWQPKFANYIGWNNKYLWDATQQLNEEGKIDIVVNEHYIDSDHVCKSNLSSSPSGIAIFFKRFRIADNNGGLISFGYHSFFSLDYDMFAVDDKDMIDVEWAVVQYDADIYCKPDVLVI